MPSCAPGTGPEGALASGAPGPRGPSAIEKVARPGAHRWAARRGRRPHRHRDLRRCPQQHEPHLLIDAGDRRILLPGDAQIEDWSWALRHAPDAPECRDLLAGVDLYKVGHHGCRNATPKTPFGLWETGPGAGHAMTALLSTMPHVHGRSEATAVPRGPLVEAIARRMNLVRTDALAPGAGSVTVAARCRGDSPFTVQADDR